MVMYFIDFGDGAGFERCPRDGYVRWLEAATTPARMWEFEGMRFMRIFRAK